MMQDFEDWLLGVIAVGGVVGALAFSGMETPVVGAAVAAEPVRADYTITVTAKRLPAICKINAAAAECTQAGAADVEFHANN